MYGVNLQTKKGARDPEDESDFIEKDGKRGNSSINMGLGSGFINSKINFDVFFSPLKSKRRRCPNILSVCHP